MLTFCDRLVPARVCIITPFQIGSNPRVVKEAQALHECGMNVTVIATRMLDIVEPRDQSVMRRIPWRLHRIDLRSRWRWRWRLLRIAQMALRRVYGVTGVAASAELGFSAFTGPVLAAALNTPADLYIAHYPAALPAAVAAARKYTARYAFDAEDFHLGDWPDGPDFQQDRLLLKAIEGRHLPGCAYVTAASPGIADAYTEAYRITRPIVVLNAFPLDQSPSSPAQKGSAEPGPSVYWFSQTIGPYRGLECAVRAVGLAVTRPHLYLRGTPVPDYVALLRQIAAEGGAADRLHILPPEAPDEMPRLAASYDIGLVADYGHTSNRAVALTNKLFTYLLAGIPAVMSDIPAHRAFASEAGLRDRLYGVENPASLARVIDHLLGNPAQLAAARSQSWRLGRERYNWECERTILLRTVFRSLE